MPVYTIPYNLGLKDSPLPESDLPKVFSRKLIIMSGGSDTNPNDPSLANFPAARGLRAAPVLHGQKIIYDGSGRSGTAGYTAELGI